MRGTRRWVVGFLIVASVGLPLGRADAGVAPGASIDVTFTPGDPVPFEPFTAAVAASGCEPGAGVDFELDRLNFISDTGYSDPFLSASATADANGDASASFPSTAYPGQWTYSFTCGDRGSGSSFHIAPPEDFRITTSLDAVSFDQPFTLAVSGAGCPGTSARWEIAIHPLAIWASGEAAVASDGSWTAPGSGLIPSSDVQFFDDGVVVGANCFIGDVVVAYPGVRLAIAAAPGSTTTTTVDGPGVGPRFTG